MALQPQPFGQIPAQAVASYDFFEFASNEGIVAFYGYNSSENNIIASGALTTNAGAFSHNLYTQTGADPINFDSNEFNAPLIMEGTATFVLPRSVTTVITTWFHVNLQKLDSSGTATSLVTASGAQVALGAGQDYRICVMRATVPETKINVGERIRVTIIGPNSAQGAGGYLGHDPQDRDTGLTGATPFGDDAIASANGRTGTKMVCLLPFKADLS